MSESDRPSFEHDRVTIRLATRADHAGIRALFEESRLEGQLRCNDTGADIDDLEAGYFDDEGASCFWVASVDDMIIGMIGVQRTRENTAEIRRLRVREAFRRRGVGRLLLEHATNFCRRNGYLKVVLDVRIDRNPAIRLFEECGFRHSGSRDAGEHRLLDFYIDLYHRGEDPPTQA
jgi:GNAT superfamily N-acetyltransferase